MSQYRTTITKGGQVTLPAKIRRKLGLKLGDQVVFREEGDAVFVEPPAFTLQTAFASIKLRRPMRDVEQAVDEAKQQKLRRDLKKGLYG